MINFILAYLAVGCVFSAILLVRIWINIDKKEEMLNIALEAGEYATFVLLIVWLFMPVVWLPMIFLNAFEGKE